MSCQTQRRKPSAKKGWTTSHTFGGSAAAISAPAVAGDGVAALVVAITTPLPPPLPLPQPVLWSSEIGLPTSPVVLVAVVASGRYPSYS